MKLSVLQEVLSNGLSIVGRAAGKWTTLPVLNNVLLTTNDRCLKLAATDLELGIRCSVHAKVEEQGAITLPARTLMDLVKGFPRERVDITLNERTASAHLQCGRYEANIKGIPAEEFPLMPDFPVARLAFDAALMEQMIEQVACAAASDESRPILTGVLLHIQSTSIKEGEILHSQLTMAAADGFRLATRHEFVARQEELEAQQLIIPARTLKELGRVLRGSEEQVQIGWGTGDVAKVFFRCGDVEIISRLIHGSFPDYTQIIPTTSTTRVLVDVEKLLQAVKLASVFAREAANIVRLTVVSEVGIVTVGATSAETGDQQGDVEAEIEMDEGPGIFTIAFNASYLTDSLQYLGTEKAKMRFTTKSNPAVVLPYEGTDLTHVIMPIHVS